MKLKFIVFIAVVFSFTACQKNEKSSVSKPVKGANEINGKGYSIQYDSSFRLDESGKNGTEFYLFTPTEPGDDFAENINLMIQNLGVLKYDLNRFVALSENQIKANGKIIESLRKNTNGQEYHVLIFEAKMNSFDLKFLQYDYVKDDKAYVLTYSAKRNEFDTHLQAAEKIMNSFQLK